MNSEHSGELAEVESFDERIGAKVTEETKERLRAEAVHRSAPGSRVSISDVVRDALREYLRE